MTNDCKTCPVSTGTHKPTEAVHQIDEPQADALRLAAELVEPIDGFQEPTMLEAAAAAELRRLHARITELEQRLEIDPRHRYDGISARDATIEAQDERIAELEKENSYLNNACAELEAQLEAIGAGGVEPLRKRAAAPQAVQAAVPLAHRHEFTDGHRTLKQDVFSAIHDYAATKPEQDPDDPESWESWFEAAFDLLGTRVGQIFEEHAARTAAAPAHPAEGVPAPAAAPVPDERAAFEAWLRVKPCGAAHDFGWAAWQARAALAATHPTQQGLDAQALKQSFREYLSVSEHIDAGGHAMDSIATDLTRIVLAEEEVSAVIARRNHCNASGQAGEDAANIRAAALAAQAKQGA